MKFSHIEKAVSVLARNPPGFRMCPARDAALLNIGRFLERQTRAGQPLDLKKTSAPLWPFILRRLETAMDEAERADLAHDAVTAWQMYNSGVVVKTGDIIIGLDVIPMPRFFGWEEPEGLTLRTAELLDVLLITHRHEDHYDKALVRACLDLGKPVLMPASLAADWGHHIALHGVEHGANMELLDLQITCRQGFHVWRATMDELPLIYYEITTPAGYTFIFSGDLDYTKVFEKTAGRDIDLLFIPWRNPNERYENGRPEQIGSTLDAVKIAVKTAQPRAILYEHYGELDHIYGGFSASYDMALDLKRELAVPSELLFWGEHMALAPPD